jgi:hypothetical protein
MDVHVLKLVFKVFMRMLREIQIGLFIELFLFDILNDANFFLELNF